MGKNYEEEKNKSVFLPAYSNLATDVCRITEDHDEKEENYLSFSELTEAFYHFSARIDHEISKILSSILESLNLSGLRCTTKVVYGNVSIASNIRDGDTTESLTYTELDGTIYLKEGPINKNSYLYTMNYKLMTEEYENLRKLYNLTLCRDVYPSSYTFICQDNWKVELTKTDASIEACYENTPKVNGEYSFLLKQSILNYYYDKKEPVRKELVVICGDPKITQYVHQNMDAFLKGFKVDISSMPFYIRENLLNYQRFEVQDFEKESKIKTLKNWFRSCRNSLKG